MEVLRKAAEKKVRREFQNFKRKMVLRQSKRELWHGCHKIHFYCCMKEYFELKETIPAVYLKLVMAEPMFLEWVWLGYLRQENAGYQSWDEIESLLDAVLMEWNQPMAG